MDNERWLDEIVGDVLVWEVSQLEQKSYIKVVGDWGKACQIKVYLEEKGYDVSIEEVGIYNQIVINR